MIAVAKKGIYVFSLIILHNEVSNLTKKAEGLINHNKICKIVVDEFLKPTFSLLTDHLL